MRTLLLLVFALLFTACGRAPHTPSPAATAPALAAPVLAPMAARARLLEDLEQQKQKARNRSAMFDDAASNDH